MRQLMNDLFKYQFPFSEASFHQYELQSPSYMSFIFDSRGQVNTRVEFQSLHSPGQYTIFPAENPQILTDLKNIIFLLEPGKDIFFS